MEEQNKYSKMYIHDEDGGCTTIDVPYSGEQFVWKEDIRDKENIRDNTEYKMSNRPELADGWTFNPFGDETMEEQNKCRQAIVNRDGTVERIMEWAGNSPFYNPWGYVIQSPVAEEGDTYDFEKRVFKHGNATEQDMRIAVIGTKKDRKNIVVCVIHWPENEDFIHPQGYTCIESDIAEVDDIYDPEQGEFYKSSGKKRE